MLNFQYFRILEVCIVPLSTGTRYCKINQNNLKDSSGFKIQYRFVVLNKDQEYLPNYNS
jgi:hypothetical protein